MKLVFLLGFLAVAVHGKTISLYNTQEIIDTVNSAHTTWKAGHNFEKDVSLKYVKSLLGVKPSKTNSKLPLKSHKDIDNSEIPEEFDSRKQWPNCPINHIVDQGTCGSCWAVAAASAFSDRACIASGGKFTLPLSAEELLTCCDDCGMGCDGGYPSSAWSFFEYNGISTGGDYGSNVGCQPYQIQPCEHHTTGKLPSCSDLPESETPECKSSCINSNYSSSSFKADHHKVKNAYSISSEVEEIQKEIMTNGPVEVSFSVYADFPTYKEGVYQYTTGGFLGGHAVRLIGWGTENGTPYWLIANSWNTDWGDKGLFKIIRGTNECGIEEDVNGGIPIVN